MNVEKAEQAVKNAQNELDEALRQLNAAKIRWEGGRPKDGCVLIAERKSDSESFTVVVLGDRAAWFRPARFMACDSVDYLVSAYRWRYAKPGEVDIKW